MCYPTLSKKPARLSCMTANKPKYIPTNWELGPPVSSLIVMGRNITFAQNEGPSYVAPGHKWSFRPQMWDENNDFRTNMGYRDIKFAWEGRQEDGPITFIMPNAVGDSPMYMCHPAYDWTIPGHIDANFTQIDVTVRALSAVVPCVRCADEGVATQLDGAPTTFKFVDKSNCHQLAKGLKDGENRMTVVVRSPGKLATISQIMYYRKP